jgi:hypothetical protein
MATATSSAIQSHDNLTELVTGTIQMKARYSFQNPNSINGPFGTLDVVLINEGGVQTAFGTVNIQTLFEMGSETHLVYAAPSHFNPSTGYTTVSAEGKGTITIWPNQAKAISAEINISLAPGFKSGTLSVEGFFEDYTLTPVSIQL